MLGGTCHFFRVEEWGECETRACVPLAFIPVSCSAYSSALKMEAKCSPKISVDSTPTQVASWKITTAVSISNPTTVIVIHKMLACTQYCVQDMFTVQHCGEVREQERILMNTFQNFSTRQPCVLHSRMMPVNCEAWELISSLLCYFISAAQNVCSILGFILCTSVGPSVPCWRVKTGKPCSLLLYSL